MIINSVFLGGAIGLVFGLFTNISSEWVIFIAIASSLFLQKYIDVFFSLVEEKNF